MQKMWCSGDSRNHNVIVARGPSALTSHQMRFSILYTVTSSVVAALLLIGLLVWMGVGALGSALAAAIAALCCIVPIVRNGVEMYRMYEALPFIYEGR